VRVQIADEEGICNEIQKAGQRIGIKVKFLVTGPQTGPNTKHRMDWDRVIAGIEDRYACNNKSSG
jgi:hypothetical protein